MDELARGGEHPAVLIRSQQLLVVIPVQGGGVGADTNVREGATSSHHLDLHTQSTGVTSRHNHVAVKGAPRSSNKRSPT
jgi:hypothetical protein